MQPQSESQWDLNTLSINTRSSKVWTRWLNVCDNTVGFCRNLFKLKLFRHWKVFYFNWICTKPTFSAFYSGQGFWAPIMSSPFTLGGLGGGEVGSFYLQSSLPITSFKRAATLWIDIWTKQPKSCTASRPQHFYWFL